MDSSPSCLTLHPLSLFPCFLFFLSFFPFMCPFPGSLPSPILSSLHLSSPFNSRYKRNPAFPHRANSASENPNGNGHQRHQNETKRRQQEPWWHLKCQDSLSGAGCSTRIPSSPRQAAGLGKPVRLPEGSTDLFLDRRECSDGVPTRVLCGSLHWSGTAARTVSVRLLRAVSPCRPSSQSPTHGTAQTETDFLTVLDAGRMRPKCLLGYFF